MNGRVELSRLVHGDRIQGEDESETQSLIQMREQAKEFLRSFSWCTTIVDSYLGFGVGNVIGLFLFRLSPPVNDSDEWLWVVVGDLPSAYFVTDDAADPSSALRIYCGLLDEWAEAVLAGASRDGVFPVEAQPTPEHARMLQRRTKFIRERLIPEIS